MDDDRVFKALADPTRRRFLDLLHEKNGMTVTELGANIEMTRFGVMSHLRVLEDAGLVASQKAGRSRQFYLNTVPIREIYVRWIDKYTEPLVALKSQLEEA